MTLLGKAKRSDFPMKHTAIVTIAAFAAGTILGTTIPRGVAAQTQIRPIKRTELFKAPVTGCDNKEMYVALLEAGQGTSGWHYHPGDSVTYVLEGSQQRETSEGKTMNRAGEVIVDKYQQLHRTENDGPVRLLVFRVLDKGRSETLYAEPSNPTPTR
jgi:quercetin dioxygenase-like cupin family protein